MHPPAFLPERRGWLLENGLEQLELLFPAIVYSSADPILIIDDDRICQAASCGMGKRLRLSRDRMIGRKIDDLLDGRKHFVGQVAKDDVLPGRHVLAPEGAGPAHDYAIYLFDKGGRIVSWYGGAERLYRYQAGEVIGQPVHRLQPGKSSRPGSHDEESNRASTRGHFAAERWHLRKDGSRFWANVVTLALRDESGELQGFGRVVRDFSACHSAEEKELPSGVLPMRDRPAEATIPGVVSGEFDQVMEANDAFFQMVGYCREDVAAHQLDWLALTPEDYSQLDELAYEEALRYGASSPFEKEYIRKNGSRVSVVVTFAILNLSPFHWITIVHAPVEAGDSAPSAGHAATQAAGLSELVGKSTAMKRVSKLVETVAPTEATVLILGETGTGKELVARAIHRFSHRKSLPFVTLNCAAIPTGLLESELFGYERGAFTGALSQKIGRFEMANHGTLFLDEVGDIPLALQPKLLRALQEKAFERLGGTKTIPIDVRLIAATNRDLTRMMAEKLFRSDLYYRLKVFPITTPPLRDHPGDIPALAHHFLQKYAQELGMHVETIPPEVMNALQHWSWPGNVRELENFIERSVILSKGRVLQAPLAELKADDTGTVNTLEEVERDYVIRVLRDANGVVSTAAAHLGIPRTSLNALMKKLGISRKDH